MPIDVLYNRQKVQYDADVDIFGITVVVVQLAELYIVHGHEDCCDCTASARQWF